jgi:hypothetical protein
MQVHVSRSTYRTTQFDPFTDMGSLVIYTQHAYIRKHRPSRIVLRVGVAVCFTFKELFADPVKPAEIRFDVVHAFMFVWSLT